MEIRKYQDSYIYFFLSVVVMLFNFFFIDYLSQKTLVVVLIFFIIFLGLPHGALDTIVAKKSKIYNSFSGFYILINGVGFRPEAFTNESRPIINNLLRDNNIEYNYPN